MHRKEDHEERIAILGAGISGLSIGWLLRRIGLKAEIFEAAEYPGGLSRTFIWHDMPCDIAPHRLHTTNKEVLGLIQEIVPLRQHKRNSCILMLGKRIQDPINPIELCLRFPPHVGAGLIKGFLSRPKLNPSSFKNLALSRYGQGLYDFFFEPYTKKMFGVSPEQISVIWGQEKLRSSGLFDIIKGNSKTFFRTFLYPKTGGYGSIPEAMFQNIKENVHLNSPVSDLSGNGGRIKAVRYRNGNQERTFECDRIFSTIPSTLLAGMFDETLPLRFKKIRLVYLHVLREKVMPYHWVYFGDGDIVINRMAEFKNFHPEMKETKSTVLCAEVTVDTETPVEDTIKALERYGLIARKEVDDILVVTENFAYPVYDKDFELARNRAERIFSRFSNLHCVGRNAEFRHIELDEDFESALKTVRKIYNSEKIASPI